MIISIMPCFNPRPYARGDIVFPVYLSIIVVSIHAPMRGATVKGMETEQWNRFQSTPLCEGRQQEQAVETLGNVVSIHAPMRGATAKNTNKFYQSLFQSTPLCEGRHLVYIVCFRLELFQSTPLCEGRRWPWS